MKLQMVGCSHHTAPVEVRERLAFSREQAVEALARFAAAIRRRRRCCFRPATAWSCISPARRRKRARRIMTWSAFLAEISRPRCRCEVFNDLFERTGEDFVRHLFTVAASLDSMVVGEAQILAQVKQAYELATSGQQRRPADECRVSGRPARGQASRHRNGDPAEAGEHSQRRRGRLRQEGLRAVRRQAGAGHRRRRDGRRDAARI